MVQLVKKIAPNRKVLISYYVSAIQPFGNTWRGSPWPELLIRLRLDVRDCTRRCESFTEGDTRCLGNAPPLCTSPQCYVKEECSARLCSMISRRSQKNRLFDYKLRSGAGSAHGFSLVSWFSLFLQLLGPCANTWTRKPCKPLPRQTWLPTTTMLLVFKEIRERDKFESNSPQPESSRGLRGQRPLLYASLQYLKTIIGLNPRRLTCCPHHKSVNRILTTRSSSSLCSQKSALASESVFSACAALS